MQSVVAKPSWHSQSKAAWAAVSTADSWLWFHSGPDVTTNALLRKGRKCHRFNFCFHNGFPPLIEKVKCALWKLKCRLAKKRKTKSSHGPDPYRKCLCWWFSPSSQIILGSSRLYPTNFLFLYSLFPFLSKRGIMQKHGEKASFCSTMNCKVAVYVLHVPLVTISWLQRLLLREFT